MEQSESTRLCHLLTILTCLNRRLDNFLKNQDIIYDFKTHTKLEAVVKCKVKRLL